jgi:hypothetical protein
MKADKYYKRQWFSVKGNVYKYFYMVVIVHTLYWIPEPFFSFDFIPIIATTLVLAVSSTESLWYAFDSK